MTTSLIARLDRMMLLRFKMDDMLKPGIEKQDAEGIVSGGFGPSSLRISNAVRSGPLLPARAYRQMKMQL